MIEIKSISDIRIIKDKGLLDCPTILNLSKFLDVDDQVSGMWYYLERLWSNSNHYKVESHIIITKSLFLMNNYGIVVDFANNKIFIECMDGSEYFIKWYNPGDLMKIAWRLLDITKDNDDDESYHYEDYRNATRAVTDHLKESDQPRSILKRLLKLTDNYVYK